MADNKSKIDSIHDLMPKHFGTRTNPNWKALIDTIGSVDQDTSNLIAEVRKQFLVKTASRPYLDRLAANNTISRPRLVGMDDPSFRQYIPVLSYKPKQVKLIIDQLLDIFFFKESTTAYITSQNPESFVLHNGWELEYTVDEINDEYIQFNSSDFTDITNTTANEVVASINRQAQYSYATAEYDSITKNTYIRIFTNTIGSKGSLQIVGGRANVSFRFNGFIDNAGTGVNTQWSVTKIGQEVTFSFVGGTSPGINELQVGDIVIINLTGNIGSFTITNVNLANQSITFDNLFATVGSFTQTDVTQVKFIRPNKYAAYLNSRRAMTWETKSGEITVEMPTSPPVVRRSLKGSGHLNGASSFMTSRDSSTSITVHDATNFPNSGTFWLEPVQAIISHYVTPSENTTITTTQNTKLTGQPQKYSYTSRTAATTTGNIVAGETQITVVSNTGIEIGQQVVMNGIPGYALVKSIVGNIINVDRAATETATNINVSFLGSHLVGISPNLPSLASLDEYTNSSITRTSNVITVNTVSSHNFLVGDAVTIYGSSGILSTTTTGDITISSNQITNLLSTVGLAPGMLISSTNIPYGAKVISISGNTITMDMEASITSPNVSIGFSEDLNGSHTIETISTNSYTFSSIGINGSTSNSGTSRIERNGLATSGSNIYITNALDSSITRILGPYLWDLSAPYVLSSDQGAISDNIQAGKIVRILNLGSNSIPSTGGFLIFDYGLNTQEGPVRYLYKPTDNTIALDSAYTFKYNHSIGSTVTLIGSNGPHKMSGSGTEYPLYITDPSEARLILESLILSVKSAGIFVNFLVRYPEQLYGTLDVYNEQGLGAGEYFR